MSPPAGAIGRGDAFLLRIAGKIGAIVLSNDSFQEFHGEHEWLFDDGRLIGGKPVPGIGWIFTPAHPGAGREEPQGGQGRQAARAAASWPPRSSGEVLGPAPTPTKPPPRPPKRKCGGDRRPAAQVAEAIAVGDRGVGHRRGSDEAGPQTAPQEARRPPGRAGQRLAAPFITFIAEHPLGSEVEGEVETFTSHGAFVLAGGARCYVPISALGDPPPTRRPRRA